MEESFGDLSFVDKLIFRGRTLDLALGEKFKMEGMSPPLICLTEMQMAVRNSEPVRSGLSRYLESAMASDDFAPELRRFLFAWDQGQEWRDRVGKIKSPHRRALIDLIAMALQGQPILSHLDELRIDLVQATNDEITQHMELLPIKMMVPLLFFQFPAFLILLFGPILSRLIEEMSK